MFPSDKDFDTSVTLENSANGIVEDEPFHILLLGEWSGVSNFTNDDTNKNVVEIDRDNFNDVLKSFKIELNLDINSNHQDVISVPINNFDDFHPDTIFAKLPCFSYLRDLKKRLSDDKSYNSAAAEVRSWNSSPELPNNDFNDSETSTENQASPENLLDRIINQSVTDSGTISQIRKSPQSELDVLISNLVKPFVINTDENEQSQLFVIVDNIIGDLMREIIHHHNFVQLESAWRGLYFLTRKVETNSFLKIFLYNISKDELSSKLKCVNNLADSVVFDLIVGNNKYSSYNWGVICSNYDFKCDVDDVALLIRLSKICAASKTSLISHLDPVAFQTFSSDDISFDHIADTLWNSLRSFNESSYLGFVLPRILSRLPYSNNIDPLESFSFEESVNNLSEVDDLWINPIFHCATLLAQSFTINGWNMENNFQLQLDELPSFYYSTDGESVFNNGLISNFTHNSSLKLMDLGFMVFVGQKNSDLIHLARFQSISNKSPVLIGSWSVT